MKRGTFLGFLAAIPAGFLAVEDSPAKTFTADTYTEHKYNLFDLSGKQYLIEQMTYWSGGIRPLDVQVDRLARTGDATKFEVRAQHPNGAWYSKVILISGLIGNFPSARRSELAYSLTMRSRELARDWAYLEWGDDWRTHVPFKGWRNV